MTFEQKHPDIVNLTSYDQLLTYKALSESGRIEEAWERADNQSPWVDVTLREQELDRLRREIEMAKREVEKLDA